jgi:hypothetical protein
MLYDDRQTGPSSTAAMTGFFQIAVIPTFGYYSIVVGRKPGGAPSGEVPGWRVMLGRVGGPALGGRTWTWELSPSNIPLRIG